MDSVLHIHKEEKQKRVKYHFCLIRCDKNNVREADFIDFLFNYILKYALTYSELHPKKILKEDITNWFTENAPHLVTKAKGRFSTSKKTGELGELFLFIALESQGFIRLINKMALKTSSKLHYQGWDSVHIGVDDDENILFCYGSSKMYRNFSQALCDIFDEIEKFSNNEQKEDVEISLISSYIDEERFGQYSKQIPKLLSPYYRKKEKIGRCHPIFLGYEWELLKKPNNSASDILDKYFCIEYKKNHEKIMDKINTKIKDLTIASKRDFLIWILPFEDVERVRSRFIRKLTNP